MSRLALLLVVALSIASVSAGFRPGKGAVHHPIHHSAHHPVDSLAVAAAAHHSRAKSMDLEEEVETPSKDLERVESEIDTAIHDMTDLTSAFERVKSDLESLKHQNHAKVDSKPTEAKPEAEVSTQVAEANDSNDNIEPIALLQIPIQDEMNNGMDDDDAPVPQVMQRMHARALIQESAEKAKKVDDAPVTFGVRNTPEGSRSYDITADGDLIVRPVSATPTPPPTAVDSMPKAPVPPINETSDNDVVCVCKRHNSAPRGKDRIRCKRHPASPSPSPSPFVAVEGIRQCANGTWAAGAETGSTDVICIYFPAILPAPPTPAPIEEIKEPEYPPECYDDRNEFVADGVIERRRFDVLLLQQGFETCGC